MAGALYVAAGGGGDAIAAFALHHAHSPASPPVIVTFAWDRLLIDPLPGPRSVDEFTDLAAVDALNFAFTPQTRPIPPAGSTLPKLAAKLDALLVLIEPAHGATGLREQLRSLVHTTNATRIVVVDVGGDVLAEGREPGLTSPLADALALAGTADQEVPVDVQVIGAGLDGELDAATVDRTVRELGGVVTHRLSAAEVEPLKSVLDWHPSEATALAAAAARGLRGVVEIRDAGSLVELSDASTNVYAFEHTRVLEHSATGRALLNSRTLDDAERAVVAVCGRSEIDYERSKASRRHQQRAPTRIENALALVDQYCPEAAGRGVDFVTFRRLAEVLGLDAADAAALRDRLIVTYADRYLPPLWSVRPMSSLTGTAGR